jgi:SNF2-related domain
LSTTETYSPGELVHARGREWIVLGVGRLFGCARLLAPNRRLKPSFRSLRAEPVTYAAFDPPAGDRPGGREAAQLLRDALRLSLRRGAGPFRGAGKINFEPRAYQLAPLMMALRQETARLLIADDVGIGKTIEAGLILREFIDRGEIDRFSILCPPHLVDQWTAELETKFSITATPVTASSAARLERDLPNTISVVEAYPFTVVSLDFIKSERRLDDFLRACPEMVVVDEAHAAVSGGRARHRRFDKNRQSRSSSANRFPKRIGFLAGTTNFKRLRGWAVSFKPMKARLLRCSNGLIHNAGEGIVTLASFTKPPGSRGSPPAIVTPLLAERITNQRRRSRESLRAGTEHPHLQSSMKIQLLGNGNLRAQPPRISLGR